LLAIVEGSGVEGSGAKSQRLIPTRSHGARLNRLAFVQVPAT